MSNPRNPYWREYRRKNAKHKREIERKSSARPEYVKHKKEYSVEYRKTHKELIKSYRKKYLIKTKARDIFREAVRTGKIKRQPCEKCGDVKSDGHHSDYTKPLKVIWLCRKHHAETWRKS